MVLSDSLVLNIVGILAATVIFVYLIFKHKYRHWKDLGVEYIEPMIPFGNANQIVSRKITTSAWFQNVYNYFKSRNVKYGGVYFFSKPSFILIDLDLIKRIVQIDFAHFTDHGVYSNEKHDPLSAHLLAMEGQKWRTMRAKLTPTFTSGKMKNMFPIMVKISEELIKILQKECDNGNPIEAKDISARFTTDIIGNCGFGIECNSLDDPNTEFRVKGKRVFKLTGSEAFLNGFAFAFPNIGRFFGVRRFPKEATDFFWNAIKDTVDYRERTGFRRNDAMQLLLEMKSKGANEDNEDTLTFRELAAQAFVFFIAGFETSSTLMSFALLELAMNQEIQDELRNDINTSLKRNNNELSYTSVQEMKYLDMVVHETLRMHAPLPFLTRVCTKEYHVPNSKVILKKGSQVFIPIRGIHYDPEYYPDPEKFDPSRFSDENKNSRHHFAFLPFGEGPRACIGLRFGMLQAKIGLAALIRNFRFTVNAQTSTPVKLDPEHFFTAALGDQLLDLEKIN